MVECSVSLSLLVARDSSPSYTRPRVSGHVLSVTHATHHTLTKSPRSQVPEGVPCGAVQGLPPAQV